MAERLELVTGGLATNQSQVTLLGLPSIEGLASEIIAVNVMRGLGLEATEGDEYMVGLSHQTDLAVTNDPDDFIGNILDNPMWWVADLTRNGSVLDRFPEPVLVAGPQLFVIHNGFGQTTAARIIVWHRPVRMQLTRWALLKTLTSFEGVA